MRCKKCGTEIREGCLFCHQCGEEVQMVPDYEPDLDEIQIKLSGEKKKVKKPEEGLTEKEQKQHSLVQIVRWRYFAPVLLLCIGFCAFIAAYFSVLEKQSPEVMQEMNKEKEEHTYLSPPVFSPEGGEYGYYLSVELSAKAGQKIYYTTDGTVPDENSFLYKNPIELSEGVTVVRAFAIDAEGNASETAEETYVLEFGIPDAPEIWPKSGDYVGEKYVKIIVPEGCAAFYTLDGSEPTENSEIYTGEFLMPEGETTVKAVLIDRKGAFSEVSSVRYHRVNAEALEESLTEL